MSSPAPNRRRFLSTSAIVLGIAAVVAATVSFFVDENPWALRITALVLIIIALGVARVSRRQPPPAEPG